MPPQWNASWTIIIALGFVATPVAITPASAQVRVAKTTTSQPVSITGECRGVGARDLIVEGESAKFELKVHNQMLTTIKVPNGIEEWIDPDHAGFDFVPMGDGFRFQIAPKVKTPAHTKTSFRVKATSKVTGQPYWATVVLVVTVNVSAARDLALIKHKSEVEALETEQETELARHAAEYAQKMQLQESIRSAQESNITTREPDGVIDVDGPLDVGNIRGRWVDDTFHITYVLEHINPGAYELAKVEVFNKYRDRNLAGYAGFYPPMEQRDNVLAVISEGQRVRGGVSVPDGADLIGPVTLVFTDANGKRLATAQIPKWKDRIYVPMSQEEIDREEAERKREEAERAREEAERLRLERARQLFVGVRGIVGAFWHGDGLGQDRLEATSFQGVGVRVIKGISPLFAFEAELIGATTGDALFKNMMIEGSQGELRRDASLGRVHLGGVLRFGETFIPTARLGLGLQGASVTSSFSIGGGLMSEDDSSFEVTASLAFGGGMDVRLGSHLLIGFAASGIFALQEKERSVDVGIHLSYQFGD